MALTAHHHHHHHHHHIHPLPLPLSITVHPRTPPPAGRDLTPNSPCVSGHVTRRRLAAARLSAVLNADWWKAGNSDPGRFPPERRCSLDGGGRARTGVGSGDENSQALRILVWGHVITTTSGSGRHRGPTWAPKAGGGGTEDAFPLSRNQRGRPPSEIIVIFQ